MKRTIQLGTQSAICLLLLFLSGCASLPYKHIGNIETSATLKLRQGEQQIEVGAPNDFIDGMGHYFFSLPSKLILWNWKMNNHDISFKTEKILKQYLHDNGLHNVKVRLNQYAPGDEWRRLFRNEDMPGFWRFSLGVIANSFYTIFPQRIFGGFFAPFGTGDHYNPYTNTIHIFSDIAPVAIHEGAHSKDFASRPRKFKGWYSLIRAVPGISLYQEGMATSDVLSYIEEKQMTEQEKESYKILYPALSTYLSSELTLWSGVDLPLQVGIIVTGHLTGRVKSSGVQGTPDQQASFHSDNPDSIDYLSESATTITFEEELNGYCI